MTYDQSQADAWYFAWKDNALVILVAWVDDVMILGPPEMVEQAQQDLERAFICNCKRGTHGICGQQLNPLQG